MWLTILKGIWEKLGGYLVLAGALLAGLFAVRQSGKSAGKQEAQQKIDKAATKAREKAREVDNQIDALGDDAIRNRAQRWVRNNKKSTS
ncbi:hypothetical protein [Allopusillimonas ginsengisoli]|uniref:hypothetical protein n=1 Tax=Allopusillimonas ginsengisoli TaxID=453575 RepID=UPI0010229F88|nr:hypothetical protein [Allopusillimonas ginsengisoli]TEA79850.1 hypothetical protein ERE07_02615 [Allopusillimonas ginsengisoli]